VAHIAADGRGGRVTTAANTAAARVVLLNRLNSGWVAVNDVTACLADPLTAVTTNAATIRRKTNLLGGQPVAMRLSGDPVSGKNGIFYTHSDHASTLRRAQGPQAQHTVSAATASRVTGRGIPATW
jgi:hypothetical protein